MNQHEKIALLFGPYRRPRLKKGERAFCLVRDRLVVVTGWTQARLPWPVGHALDPRGAGRGILVDDELAKAIRHESVLALRYWWGVSRSTAERWRRAYEVGRMDTEGSRRPILGVIQQGVASRQAVRCPRSRASSRPLLICGL
jgi:hypothetical protein